MEDLQTKPTPLPRSSPILHTQHNAIGQQIKKPVPLPRSLAVPVASSSKSGGVEDKTNSESSSFKEVLTKSYNTLTKSKKNKLKSASGNVQEKSKGVFETSKTVGLKKELSIRGILHKQQSVLPTTVPSSEVDCVGRKVDRCQSLPSENIFSSIKFGSPIQQDHHPNNAYDSDNDVFSLPPPEYPPPPLPDESLYDELSTKSSHSGSHGDYYTCPSIISSIPDIDDTGNYEDVPDLNHLSMCGGSDSSLSNDLSIDTQSIYQNKCESNCGSPRSSDISSEFKSVRVSRSESWSFYDTVHMPSKKPTCEQYVNVTIHNRDSRNAKTNANEKSTSSETEHKIIALKPLQPIKISDGCRDSAVKSSLERQESMISNTGSEGSSMSVPNELYLNWQPLLLNKPQEDNVDRETHFKYTTKSFFSEFDPLYENFTSNSESTKKCLETESLPLFNDEENNDLPDDFDTASLPVPPTRYDSIDTILSEQPNIPNDVEYYLYHRPTSSFPIKDEFSNSTDSQGNTEYFASTEEITPSNSPERELSQGKRKSNIERWSSMKRAIIKKVADASSHWSPGTSRKTPKNKEEEVPLKEGSSQEIVDRLCIKSSSGPIHSGFLFRSPSGGEKQKDFVQKWCQLAEGRLTFSAEKNSSNKDVLLLEHIYSFQIVRETKQRYDYIATY